MAVREFAYVFPRTAIQLREAITTRVAIGSGAENYAPAPSHTTERAVFGNWSYVSPHLKIHLCFAAWRLSRFAMKTIPVSRSRGLSRRRFFKSSSAVTGVFLLGAPAFLRGKGLNEKLNIAVIGAGGRGAADTAEVARTENIVALCDVSGLNLHKAAQQCPQART